MVRHPRASCIAVTILFAFVIATSQADVNYESPPVHPIELAASGAELYVAHTADHRLVVFDLTGAEPEMAKEIMVGIEPVSVRARTANEVWVVNHISGSVSIVDLVTNNITRTLIVGALPTDVAFANGKAFVSVSQEDLIRVYDLSDLELAPTDIPLDGHMPRSLALSPDSSTVYVTIFDSGNKTTIVPFAAVDTMGGPPPPNPPMAGGLPTPPRPGLIVRHDGTNWVDEDTTSWDSVLPYTLYDNDVIAINTLSLAVTTSYSGVGTNLFNVVVDPVSGELFVTNQEAANEIRFEPNIKGQFLQNRITHINPLGSVVTPHHLNTHINYSIPAGDAIERAMSLGMPMDVDINNAGTELFVAAFLSKKVGVVSAAGTVTRRIDVGHGPVGVALDEPRNTLYVFNRTASSLSVVDLTDDSSVEISLGFDPTPMNVVDGRRVFNDGEMTSAHGDLACSSCHIFADLDGLAWNLGDPTGQLIPPVDDPQMILPDFHPMKGPMITQSLKALPGTEPFHWRGDRFLIHFNPAFTALMGATDTLSTTDFQLMEDYLFSIAYPPNPFRNVDDTLPALINGNDPTRGKMLFTTGGLFGGAQCISCHSLPGGSGTIVLSPPLVQDEPKVVPQLRNMWQKGRFDNQATTSVRGFGFSHDGAIDDLFSFMQISSFTFANDQDRRDVTAFLLAFDTGTHGGIGAQLTMDGTNEVALLPRLNALEGEADLASIGLIAKGVVTGQARGWLYAGGGMYTPDKVLENDITQTALLALAGPGNEITFTGVPTSCANRLALDRDLDTFFDGDELDVGSDPGDPLSNPNLGTGIGELATRTPSALWLAGRNPVTDRANFGFRIGRNGATQLNVYDVKGRLVRRLVGDNSRAAGTFAQEWDLRNENGQRVSSGIYFVRLKTPDAVRVSRIAVIR